MNNTTPKITPSNKEKNKFDEFMEKADHYQTNPWELLSFAKKPIMIIFLLVVIISIPLTAFLFVNDRKIDRFIQASNVDSTYRYLGWPTEAESLIKCYFAYDKEDLFDKTISIKEQNKWFYTDTCYSLLKSSFDKIRLIEDEDEREKMIDTYLTKTIQSNLDYVKKSLPVETHTEQTNLQSREAIKWKWLLCIDIVNKAWMIEKWKTTEEDCYIPLKRYYSTFSFEERITFWADHDYKANWLELDTKVLNMITEFEMSLQKEYQSAKTK